MYDIDGVRCVFHDGYIVECIGGVDINQERAEPVIWIDCRCSRMERLMNVKGSGEVKEDNYDEGTRVRSKLGGNFYECSFISSGSRSQTEASTIADWSGGIVEAVRQCELYGDCMFQIVM